MIDKLQIFVPKWSYLMIISGLLSVVLGGMVMWGWHFNVPGLVQVQGTQTEMYYNAALCFVLVGMSLLLGMAGRLKWMFYSSLPVLFISLLTVLEYALQIDLGIDNFLLNAVTHTTPFVPGRMAPNTAIAFVLLSISAVLYAHLTKASIYQHLLIGMCSAGATALGLIALTGYFMGLETTYGWGKLTRMALHTAAGITLTGVAFFTLNVQRSNRNDYFVQFPIPLFIGVTVLTLCLWQALLADANRQWHVQLQNLTHTLQRVIERQSESQFETLARMADRWEFRQSTSKEEWERDATAYVHDMDGLVALFKFNQDLKLESKITSQFSTNDLPTRVEVESAAFKATLGRTLTLKRDQPSKPMVLADVGTVFFYLPLYVGDALDGVIVAQYSIEAMLMPIMTLHVGQDYHVIILAGAHKIFEKKSASETLPASDFFQEHKGMIESANVNIGALRWQISVGPSESLIHNSQSTVPKIVLVSGMMVAIILAVLSFYIRLASIQSKSLKQEVLERIRIEKALHEAKNRLSEAAIISELGIWEWDVVSGHLVWDARMHEIYELSENVMDSELIYDHWVGRLHRDDREAVTQALAGAMRGEEEWESEFRLEFDGGRAKYVRASASIVYENGKPIKLIGGNLDVTSQKELVNKLNELKELAENTSRSKSEFLANMSHEIRTPMNGIIGISEMLGRTNLNYQQRDYLELIQKSSSALMNILNDILDLSKIEANKLTIEEVPFDLIDHLSDAVKCFSGNAHSKSLDLTMYFDQGVPKWILGDSVRIKQVLFNLIGNAIKFTAKGEVRVSVLFNSGTSELAISVRDTGIGIAKDKQALIFNAFSQADSSTTRNFGGTGLGLSIVMHLVSLMSGRIEIDSEVGSGTEMLIYLPVKVAPDIDLEKNYISDFSSLKVFLISQNNTNKRWITNIVNDWGCEIIDFNKYHEFKASTPENLLQSSVLILDSDSIASYSELEETISRGARVILLVNSGSETEAASITTTTSSLRTIIKPVKQSELYNCIVMLLDYTGQQRAITETHSQFTRPLNILAAEDNEINQRILCDLLEDEGHHVTLVENGSLAIESYLMDRFDIVLMDIQMPVKDGFEATKAIRGIELQTKIHTPIVALTANAFQEDREQCLQAGMDDYLSKPLDPDELMDVIYALTSLEYAPKPENVEVNLAGEFLNFDLDKALKVTRNNDARLIKICKLFFHDIESLSESIEVSIVRRDEISLEKAIHSLCGSVGSFCSQQLLDRLQYFRREVTSGTWIEVDANWADIKREVYTLAGEIKDYLQRKSLNPLETE